MRTCSSFFVLIWSVCGLLAYSASISRAQTWQAVPIVTQASLSAGVKGGEGAQVIRTLAISASDPNFVMMGTDVGGIYRSLDSGKNWQVCMVGWNARGGNHFALDPKNANRLLGMAGNGSDWNAGWGASPNGVYLSTDKGASWKPVLSRLEGNDARASLAYDPSSYDTTLGYCKIAYYDSRDGGLFKCVDGGQTWKQVNASYSGMVIRVHPTKGYVYLASNDATKHGLYRSLDGGATFTKLNAVNTLNIDVIASRPGNVYAARADGVQISTDAGLTFKAPANSGLPASTTIIDVAASPANPNNLTCWHGGAQWWEAYHYYSNDGGATWKKQAWDNTNAFFPNNVRGGPRAWHPTQANVVFGEGGDWITKSTDSGATFAWAANGYNAVMVGSSFGFSPADPTLVYLSFQDYDGATTTDGGKTWTYSNPAGNGWGGFEYGGLALDKNHMWSGDAPSWGGTRTLKVSTDGGATWTIKKSGTANITFSGPDVSCADPANPNVGFASNWRTGDKGATWTALNGCDAVFTYNPTGAKELYGKHGNDIVKSLDHGVTWTKVATIDGGITDLAYDQLKQRFWIASGDTLKKYESGMLSTVAIPTDQSGGTRVGSVAVDPGNPNVIYAANHRDIYACNNAVVRSTDGGVTWKNLTVTAPLTNGTAAGGPHEVQWLRVNPRTHYLWAAGQCFGVWKMAPPVRTDFSGNGQPSILFQNMQTGSVAAWLMNGIMLMTGASLGPSIPATWHAAAMPDLNNDGQPDILFQNHVTGDVAAWLMNGTTLTGSAKIASNIPSDWQVAATGDFNGDGQADILWQNNQTGAVAVWLMQGTTLTASLTVVASMPAGWKVAGCADFDADGQADIVWQNTLTGGAAIWYMNGAAYRDYATLTAGIPTVWQIAAVADYDGDGNPDLLWRNGQTGDVTYWLLNNALYLGGGTLAASVPLTYQIVGPR